MTMKAGHLSHDSFFAFFFFFCSFYFSGLSNRIMRKIFSHWRLETGASLLHLGYYVVLSLTDL